MTIARKLLSKEAVFEELKKDPSRVSLYGLSLLLKYLKSGAKPSDPFMIEHFYSEDGLKANMSPVELLKEFRKRKFANPSFRFLGDSKLQEFTENL